MHILVRSSGAGGRRIGGYAEHRFTTVKLGGKSQPLDGPHVSVKLAPGSGARLTFTMNRVERPSCRLASSQRMDQAKILVAVNLTKTPCGLLA